MKTYLGLEVNYCEFCGSDLITRKTDRNIFFASCPKREKYFGLSLDTRHSNFYLGEGKYKKYDAETGEPV